MKRKSSRIGLVKDIYHQITWFEADLFDYEIIKKELEEVDVIIHSAAIISFIKKDVNEMFKVNIQGTANLLNAALESKVDQFLQISSIAALGRSSDYPIVTESTEFQNSKLDTAYGQSKYLAEKEVWRAGNEGLSVTIINPAMIMGAGYWDTGTSKLVDTIYKRLNFYPVGRTGFVDVRDVARMSIEMLERKMMDTNMICSGESMKIQDMLDLICRGLEIPEPTIKLTPFLRGLAWRMEWLRAKLTGSKQLITRETISTSASQFTFDNTKSKTEMGFEYTPLSKTMEQTCALYLEGRKIGLHYAIMPME